MLIGIIVFTAIFLLLVITIGASKYHDDDVRASGKVDPKDDWRQKVDLKIYTKPHDSDDEK